MHALIIEDDYLISRAIEDQLRNLGFSSFSFARSQDGAVAAAADRHPDLITADARLLPGNGVDAVKSISLDRRCAVVFITGYAPDVERSMPDAIIIQKPVKEEELKRAVAEAFERARP